MRTILVASVLAFQIVPTGSTPDPFAFFQPSATVTADERRELDRGHSIARVLPGTDREIAVFAAVPVAVDGDRLVRWMRRIEALKKSAYVLAIHRFSDPPRLDDLAGLTLDADDASDIRKCRPEDCALELSPSEVVDLQHATSIERRFRELMLDRVNAYLAGRWRGDAFARLVAHAAFLPARVPEFADHLSRGVPRPPIPHVESFLYWSKERLATKPILRITDVNILRSDEPALPDALVAGKEIFAARYLDASLGLTALVRGAPGGSNYLVYMNRSEVDMLHGMFGGLLRWFIERRLKTEAANVLEGLRHRLESGDPPPVAPTERP